MDSKIMLDLLSAGVIASLVTGIFSLVVSFKNNKRLKELERYKGLREAYTELLNILPQEKLVGFITINSPAREGIPPDLPIIAEANMKIMCAHFSKVWIFVFG